MDLTGSLVDTNLKIFPSVNLLRFLENIPVSNDIPANFMKFMKITSSKHVKHDSKSKNNVTVQLTNKDIEDLNNVKKIMKKEESEGATTEESDTSSDTKSCGESLKDDESREFSESSSEHGTLTEGTAPKEGPYLYTSDIDWLYSYLQKKRLSGEKDIPYLHVLLQGSYIETPQNKVLKRNPELEARCVKLRAQQEAREYRKMTKTVDNVRMRFPEDSISYQLKQVNRQLIAIGQFIISIFAGFLFGFKGIEWTIGEGSLDFGFRLLLGVMCALIIALAEIYFLAKKLNEELNLSETTQIGGPPKFDDEKKYATTTKTAPTKTHQD